ncbi:hypothetical protein F5X97DRAFT_317763 [Nemania serpens]|nr:hypothetical protein F5X97DRAFT_317763 [Nemania serpens]
MAAPNLVALRAWMGRGDDGIISRTDVGILGQRAPHPQGDSVRQGVWMLLFVVVVVVVTMFMDRMARHGMSGLSWQRQSTSAQWARCSARGLSLLVLPTPWFWSRQDIAH